MTTVWTILKPFGKRSLDKRPFVKYSLLMGFVFLSACSVNPATGDRQFTGLFLCHRQSDG